MTTNRERLHDLMGLLDEAPFDVSWLRQELEPTVALPESDVAEVLRRALARIDHAQFAVSFAHTQSDVEAQAHQRVIDWLATARAVLRDHTVN